MTTLEPPERAEARYSHRAKCMHAMSTHLVHQALNSSKEMKKSSLHFHAKIFCRLPSAVIIIHFPALPETAPSFNTVSLENLIKAWNKINKKQNALKCFFNSILAQPLSPDCIKWMRRS